jgi:putative transposase
MHVNVTAHPTAAWIWRQFLEATPWGRQARYLLRDRDAVSSDDLVQRTRRLGIQSLLSPVRGLRANAVAESIIRTLRNKCRDHLITVNEQHLRTAVAEFVRYYNTDRPHRSLLLDTPCLPSVPGSAPSTRGPF